VIADPDVVVARVALVGAAGPDLVVVLELGGNILARQVPAGRERGLEQRDRTVGLGERLAVDGDGDVARAVAQVDPVVGVARVNDRLLILLEPAVERLEPNADQALGEPLLVDPGRLLRQRFHPHVLAGKAPDREAARHVEQLHPAAVDHRIATEEAANPPGRVLQVLHRTRRVEVEFAAGMMAERPASDGEGHRDRF